MFCFFYVYSRLDSIKFTYGKSIDISDLISVAFDTITYVEIIQCYNVQLFYLPLFVHYMKEVRHLEGKLGFYILQC